MTTPLFAQSYVDGFLDFWRNSFRSADSIVLFTLIVGAVCIAIILTGGKWNRK